MFSPKKMIENKFNHRGTTKVQIFYKNTNINDYYPLN